MRRDDAPACSIKSDQTVARRRRLEHAAANERPRALIGTFPVLVDIQGDRLRWIGEQRIDSRAAEFADKKTRARSSTDKGCSRRVPLWCTVDVRSRKVSLQHARRTNNAATTPSDAMSAPTTRSTRVHPRRRGQRRPICRHRRSARRSSIASRRQLVGRESTQRRRLMVHFQHVGGRAAAAAVVARSTTHPVANDRTTNAQEMRALTHIHPHLFPSPPLLRPSSGAISHTPRRSTVDRSTRLLHRKRTRQLRRVRRLDLEHAVEFNEF